MWVSKGVKNQAIAKIIKRSYFKADVELYYEFKNNQNNE